MADDAIMYERVSRASNYSTYSLICTASKNAICKRVPGFLLYNKAVRNSTTAYFLFYFPIADEELSPSSFCVEGIDG